MITCSISLPRGKRESWDAWTASDLIFPAMLKAAVFAEPTVVFFDIVNWRTLQQMTPGLVFHLQVNQPYMENVGVRALLDRGDLCIKEVSPEFPFGTSIGVLADMLKEAARSSSPFISDPYGPYATSVQSDQLSSRNALSYATASVPGGITAGVTATRPQPGTWTRAGGPEFVQSEETKAWRKATGYFKEQPDPEPE